MGTQAYQNTSAFQHNTSPGYTASQFKSLSPAGVEQSTFGDGTQSLQNQALSRLSVQIMGTENTSYAQQDHLNSAMSMLESKSLASSQATDAALSETTNFLSQVGKAMSSGEDFHKSVSASEAKTLQDFKNYVNDIQQSTGMTEARAFEAAVGASSGALQLIGVDIKGGFSSSSARNQAIHAAESIANQTNYSDNLDKVVSAAQSFSEAHNDTKNAELGRGVTSSLNQAKGLREEMSVAQNQVDTLSHDISSAHGKSLSINKDLTQSVLDFIAHQPVNSGPSGSSQGIIGHERARQILENGGAERDAYLQRFQEENPQYSIQSINSGQERTGLTSKFESASGNIAAHASMMGTHAQNTERVLGQASKEDLHPNKMPESRQAEILDSLKRQDGVIGQKKQTIDKHERELQDAEKTSKDQYLVSAALNNTFGSVMPDTDEVFQKLAEKDPTYKHFLAGQQGQAETLRPKEKTPLPSTFAEVQKDTRPTRLSSKIEK